LTKRGTDSTKAIENRLSNAVHEIKRVKEYDFLLINDSFDEALEGLVSIVYSSKHKTSSLNTKEFIDSWAHDKELKK
jgi:guanylate kinase